MPYIKKSRRAQLDDGGDPQDSGELNYAITRKIDRYIRHRGLNYASLNETVGVLECAKLELYRRIAAAYEDRKIGSPEHGDVYTVLLDQ